MKFRKRPVVVDAVEVKPGYWSNPSDWPDWFFHATQKAPSEPGAAFLTIAEDGLEAVAIATLEGTMEGHIGDWIIQGVQGELYPCKPDIFELTYERVEEEDA